MLSFMLYSIKSALFSQNSLNLEQYYPKPKITSIEFLMGPSVVSIRGASSRVTYSNQGGYYTNYISHQKNKTAYTIGLGFEHTMSKRFAIDARLLWERKGYIDSFDSLTRTSSQLVSIGNFWTQNIKNDYLTISIVPQFKLGHKNQVNIGAGAYLSSLVFSNTIYKSTTFIYSFSSIPNYNKYDYGLSINVGTHYNLNEHLALTVQFIVNYGLYQISNRLLTYDYPKWYNNSFAFLFGIKYFK